MSTPWLSFDAHNAEFNTSTEARAVRHPSKGNLVYLTKFRPEDASKLVDLGFSQIGQGLAIEAKNLNLKQLIDSVFPQLTMEYQDKASIDATQEYLSVEQQVERKSSAPTHDPEVKLPTAIRWLRNNARPSSPNTNLTTFNGPVPPQVTHLLTKQLVQHSDTETTFENGWTLWKAKLGDEYLQALIKPTTSSSVAEVFCQFADSPDKFIDVSPPTTPYLFKASDQLSLGELYASSSQNKAGKNATTSTWTSSKDKLVSHSESQLLSGTKDQLNIVKTEFTGNALLLTSERIPTATSENDLKDILGKADGFDEMLSELQATVENNDDEQRYFVNDELALNGSFQALVSGLGYDAIAFTSAEDENGIALIAFDAKTTKWLAVEPVINPTVIPEGYTIQAGRGAYSGKVGLLHTQSESKVQSEPSKKGKDTTAWFSSITHAVAAIPKNEEHWANIKEIAAQKELDKQKAKEKKAAKKAETAAPEIEPIKEEPTQQDNHINTQPTALDLQMPDAAERKETSEKITPTVSDTSPAKPALKMVSESVGNLPEKVLLIKNEAYKLIGPGSDNSHIYESLQLEVRARISANNEIEIEVPDINGINDSPVSTHRSTRFQTIPEIAITTDENLAVIPLFQPNSDLGAELAETLKKIETEPNVYTPLNEAFRLNAELAFSTLTDDLQTRRIENEIAGKIAEAKIEAANHDLSLDERGITNQLQNIRIESNSIIKSASRLLSEETNLTTLYSNNANLDALFKLDDHELNNVSVLWESWVHDLAGMDHSAARASVLLNLKSYGSSDEKSFAKNLFAAPSPVLTDNIKAPTERLATLIQASTENGTLNEPKLADALNNAFREKRILSEYPSKLIYASLFQGDKSKGNAKLYSHRYLDEIKSLTNDEREKMLVELAELKHDIKNLEITDQDLEIYRDSPDRLTAITSLSKEKGLSLLAARSYCNRVQEKIASMINEEYTNSEAYKVVIAAAKTLEKNNSDISIEYGTNNDEKTIDIKGGLGRIQFSSLEKQQDNYQLYISSSNSYDNDTKSIYAEYKSMPSAEILARDMQTFLDTKKTEILVNSAPDFGQYANEKIPGTYSQEIKKNINADRNSGKLPKGLKVSATSRSGSIDITITDLPKTFKLYSDEYIQESLKSDDTSGRPSHQAPYSMEGLALLGVIKSHSQAYNVVTSYDPYGDYGSSYRMYPNVDIAYKLQNEIFERQKTEFESRPTREEAEFEILIEDRFKRYLQLEDAGFTYDQGNRYELIYDEKASICKITVNTLPPLTLEGGKQHGLALITRLMNQPSDIQKLLDEQPTHTKDSVELYADGWERVTHTTKRDKVLTGVVDEEISLSEAKNIDKFAFHKDGGVFIRNERIEELNQEKLLAARASKNNPSPTKKTGPEPTDNTAPNTDANNNQTEGTAKPEASQLATLSASLTFSYPPEAYSNIEFTPYLEIHSMSNGECRGEISIQNPALEVTLSETINEDSIEKALKQVANFLQRNMSVDYGEKIAPITNHVNYILKENTEHTIPSLSASVSTSKDKHGYAIWIPSELSEKAKAQMQTIAELYCSPDKTEVIELERGKTILFSDSGKAGAFAQLMAEDLTQISPITEQEINKSRQPSETAITPPISQDAHKALTELALHPISQSEDRSTQEYICLNESSLATHVKVTMQSSGKTLLTITPPSKTSGVQTKSNHILNSTPSPEDILFYIDEALSKQNLAPTKTTHAPKNLFAPKSLLSPETLTPAQQAATLKNADINLSLVDSDSETWSIEAPEGYHSLLLALQIPIDNANQWTAQLANINNLCQLLYRNGVPSSPITRHIDGTDITLELTDHGLSLNYGKDNAVLSRHTSITTALSEINTVTSETLNKSKDKDRSPSYKDLDRRAELSRLAKELPQHNLTQLKPRNDSELSLIGVDLDLNIVRLDVTANEKSLNISVTRFTNSTDAIPGFHNTSIDVSAPYNIDSSSLANSLNRTSRDTGYPQIKYNVDPLLIEKPNALDESRAAAIMLYHSLILNRAGETYELIGNHNEISGYLSAIGGTYTRTSVGQSGDKWLFDTNPLNDLCLILSKELIEEDITLPAPTRQINEYTATLVLTDDVVKIQVSRARSNQQIVLNSTYQIKSAQIALRNLTHDQIHEQWEQHNGHQPDYSTDRPEQPDTPENNAAVGRLAPIKPNTGRPAELNGRGLRNSAELPNENPGGGLEQESNNIELPQEPTLNEESSRTSEGSRKLRNHIDQPEPDGTETNSQEPIFQITEEEKTKPNLTKHEVIQLNTAALEALHKSSNDGESLTEEEKRALMSYQGFGNKDADIDFVFNGSRAIRSQAFPAAHKLASIIEKFSEEDQQTLKESSLSAFYTPIDASQFMWSAMQRMGIEQADSLRISEPSCGNGVFIGTAPPSIREKGEFIGVEMDGTSQKIAQALYPEARIIHSPFEKLPRRENTYDVVIGNPPYGDLSIYNKRIRKRQLIHDMFLQETIHELIPGGLHAFVTSAGTLDKASEAVRKDIYKSSDLIAAIRQPSTAFESTGTSVITDILFFRKRMPGEEKGQDQWLKSIKTALPMHSGDETELIRVNQYFLDNPEMVLGELQAKLGQYGYKMHCQAKGELPLKEQRLALLEKLPQDIYTGHEYQKTASPQPEENIAFTESINDSNGNTKHLKQGNYIVNSENNVAFITYDALAEQYTSVEIKKNRKQTEAIKRYIPLRDTVATLLDMEALSPSTPAEIASTEAQLAMLRKKLNDTYDDFRENHGELQSKANARILNADPDYFGCCGLEAFDKETKTLKKADVFNQRVQAPARATQCDTLNDAIYSSLNLDGTVTPGRVCELFPGITKETFDLKTKDLLFIDPETGSYTPRDVYLSGHLGIKIEKAKEALPINRSFQKNIDALTEALPNKKPFAKINIKLGQEWIGPEIYTQFLRDTLKVPLNHYDRVAIIHRPIDKEWLVRLTDKYSKSEEALKYNTPDYSFLQLLYAALNQKDTIVNKINANGNPFQDNEATGKARLMRDALNLSFQDWARSNESQAKLIENRFNANFNSWREFEPRPESLTIKGMANTFRGSDFSLRPTQSSAILRSVISSHGQLIAHEAGGGKTMIQAGIAMKLKELGIYNKPTIVVPNHMLVQFTFEAYEMFPNARILTILKNEINPKNRALFASKVALNNWDIIILTGEMMKKMQLSEEYRQDYFQNELDQHEELIRASHTSGDKIAIKGLSRKIKNIQAKIDQIDHELEEQSDQIYFDKLGIDGIIYDEAHRLKNYGFPTKLSDVAGVNSKSSVASLDMMMKAEYLANARGDYKGVQLATGTPIVNTLGEAYVYLKMLSPDILDGMSCSTFDSFVATFGETPLRLELRADGKSYVTKRRLCEYKNVPELSKLFRSIADIKFGSDFDFKKPKVNYNTIVSKKSPLDNLVMDWLAYRIEDKDEQEGPAKMLKVGNDGRMAAIDLRLLHPNIPEQENSKLREGLKPVIKRYRQHEKDSRTQLIFLDMGTPGSKNINLYAPMREFLVENGIKREEVAFIHDAKDDNQKEALFKKMREGTIRVLFASRPKAGVGTNVQDRIVGLTNMNIPYTPAELEQGNKRADRQGNLFPDVYIDYVTKEGSFDLVMLDKVHFKLGMVKQILSDPDSIEDEFTEDCELSPEEIMAITSDNKTVKLKLETDAKVRDLTRERELVSERKAMLSSDLYHEKSTISILSKTVEEYTALYEKIGDEADLIIAGKTVGGWGSHKKAGEALKYIIGKLPTAMRRTHEVGKISGMPIRFSKSMGYFKLSACFEIRQSHSKDCSVNIKNLLSIPNMLAQEIASYKSSIKERSEAITNIEKAMNNCVFNKEDELTSLKEEQIKLDAAFIEEQNNTPDRQLINDMHPFSAYLEALDIDPKARLEIDENETWHLYYDAPEKEKGITIDSETEGQEPVDVVESLISEEELRELDEALGQQFEEQQAHQQHPELEM